jgi:hypothetical protein
MALTAMDEQGSVLTLLRGAMLTAPHRAEPFDAMIIE